MSLLIAHSGVQHGPTPGGVDSTPTAGVTADSMRAAIATHFQSGGQQPVHDAGLGCASTPAKNQDNHGCRA